MAVKESTPTSLLSLGSIKSRITAYALVASLLPSLTMGWFFFTHNKRVFEEKIEIGLRNDTLNAARDVQNWLVERRGELLVFAGSTVVTESLNQHERRTLSSAVAIDGYLKSIQTKLDAHLELIVCDINGQHVASSEGRRGSPLPAALVKRVVLSGKSRAVVSMDDLSGQVLFLAEPVRDQRDTIRGLLATKLRPANLSRILEAHVGQDTDEILLLDDSGRLIASSNPANPGFLSPVLPPIIRDDLLADQLTIRGYAADDGTQVMGIAKEMPAHGWLAVGQLDVARAHIPIAQLRNTTLAIVAGLMVAIALIAYFLGLSIVKPLKSLARGAGQVAGGDLDVKLPVIGHGEVAYLTRVFNHMVSRLKANKIDLEEAQQKLLDKNVELEAISITDNLTGLYNRKHLMEALETETARSVRNDKTFVILLIDIDNFKRHNDAYGHMAGDDVLKTLGHLFKNSIRACDIAARYGGEEFLLILPEIGLPQGIKTAERIRELVAAQPFKIGNTVVYITVSIGVATFPVDGNHPDELFIKADKALYKAKASGRNKVVAA